MFGHGRRLACSFCGKKDADVAKLVAGPKVYVRRRVYICDACVGVASRIMEDADGQGPRMLERQAGSLEGLLGRVLSGWKSRKSSSECRAAAE